MEITEKDIKDIEYMLEFILYTSPRITSGNYSHHTSGITNAASTIQRIITKIKLESK